MESCPDGVSGPAKLAALDTDYSDVAHFVALLLANAVEDALGRSKGMELEKLARRRGGDDKLLAGV